MLPSMLFGPRTTGRLVFDIGCCVWKILSIQYPRQGNLWRDEMRPVGRPTTVNFLTWRFLLALGGPPPTRASRLASPRHAGRRYVLRPLFLDRPVYVRRSGPSLQDPQSSEYVIATVSLRTTACHGNKRRRRRRNGGGRELYAHGRLRPKAIRRTKSTTDRIESLVGLLARNHHGRKELCCCGR